MKLALSFVLATLSTLNAFGQAITSADLRIQGVGLRVLTQTATAFRSPGIDLLGSLNANALSIVIELPKSQLNSSTAADAKIGVWATTSR